MKRGAHLVVWAGRFPRLALGVGLALWLGALCGVAVAQPADKSDRPADERPGLFEPEALKARLQRRLEELKREQERVAEGLARLEKGESPAAVVRDLPRPGLRGRRGPEGEGGPSEEGHKGDGPRGEGQRGEGPKGDRRPGKDGRGPGGMGGLGGPGGPGGPPPDMRPPTPEEREELLGVLREHMPRLAAALDEVGRVDAEAKERMLERWMPRLREAQALRRRDPEMFKLKLEEMQGGFRVLEASKAVREASVAKEKDETGAGERLEAAKGVLREALHGQFDNRMSIQQREIDALNARIEELRQRIARQRENKDQAIEQIVRRVVEGKGGPGDGPDGSGGPGGPGGPGVPGPKGRPRP